MFGLVILTLLAVLPEFFVVFGDVNPEVVPLDVDVLYVWVIEWVLSSPLESFLSISSSIYSFSISISSPVSRFFILNLTIWAGFSI